MDETAKPVPVPNDSAIIDKVEKAAEAAAFRGVTKAVDGVYATYGPRVIEYEALTIGGAILTALLVFAAVKAVCVRLFARKA